MFRVLSKIGVRVESTSSYGMDSEPLANESRKPLSSRFNIPNPANPYPECSQHIQAEKEQARRIGLKEGIQEGRYEEKLLTAAVLLKIGLSDEKIIQATRLTAEQLEGLKRNKEQTID